MKIIPRNYERLLGVRETELAIKFVKDTFERTFAEVMNLERISAPMFVETGEGLNDDLNGVERPVSFDIPAAEVDGQVVHSLAKWKRMALLEYGFPTYGGLYTDMNAIRRDEELDNIHSIYVDQWDWERIITEKDRNADYLKGLVSDIVDTISEVSEKLRGEFPELGVSISRNVKFITSEELREMYPDLTPEEREYRITKEHKTVFVMQIGGKLSDGTTHGGRAPDYDDWSLNGDILFYHECLDIALEISSMGIRVDREALLHQLAERGAEERANLPFHKRLLAGELPLTVGGGIGQSRLCMLLLGTAHIGEVQASIWDEETRRVCRERGIHLL